MNGKFLEQNIRLEVKGYHLFGILSEPNKKASRAVIIVVGGPQYRVGSHRQFILLARHLARQGVLVLRFDYSGMGYSEGFAKKFYEIDEDLRAAVDFIACENIQIKNICVWGLCDAASAIAFSAHTDDRIKGIVLLNPWIRDEASHSKAILKNYYRDRLFSPDVWKQLLRSPAKIFRAVASIAKITLKVLKSRSSSFAPVQADHISIAEREQNIAAAVLKGMSHFKGQICLILSGKDLVADEFKQLLEDREWLENDENRRKTRVVHVNEADHTFSSKNLRSKVENVTLDFVNAIA